MDPPFHDPTRLKAIPPGYSGRVEMIVNNNQGRRRTSFWISFANDEQLMNTSFVSAGSLLSSRQYKPAAVTPIEVFWEVATPRTELDSEDGYIVRFDGESSGTPRSLRVADGLDFFTSVEFFGRGHMALMDPVNTRLWAIQSHHLRRCIFWTSAFLLTYLNGRLEGYCPVICLEAPTEFSVLLAPFAVVRRLPVLVGGPKEDCTPECIVNLHWIQLCCDRYLLKQETKLFCSAYVAALVDPHSLFDGEVACRKRDARLPVAAGSGARTFPSLTANFAHSRGLGRQLIVFHGIHFSCLGDPFPGFNCWAKHQSVYATSHPLLSPPLYTRQALYAFAQCRC
ncbi:hypothetical protein BDN72DRAFT_863713 [Pluteus cervinus]|uniref:Uncharacterized protein n=1 Tax=Pluteus cervinus TaxID=181527 RepID=A0ACD3A632_9AGAR|nr:hypothetical protein BDN72DRAFT_863713 [Pluteus cervinus]